MSELIGLLNEHRLKESSSMDEVKSKIAHAVDTFLDDNLALLNGDLREALIKAVGSREVHIGRYFAFSNELCAPSTNSYLKDSRTFRYREIRDAFSLVMGDDNTGYKIVVGRGDKPFAGGRIIYYKTEDSLRKFLTPRVREKKRVVYYDFSAEPFEKS
jgi:hypothetical protein